MRWISIYIVKGGQKHEHQSLNTYSDANNNFSRGKPKKASRRFTQLKTDASHEDLKAFSQMIEKLTGEQYDAIELMTSENIQ